MKRLSLILGIMLLGIISNAQTPYYFYNYKGERIYLSLNTEYAFLSVKEQQLPVDIQQRNIRAGKLQSDRSDQKQDMEPPILHKRAREGIKQGLSQSGAPKNSFLCKYILTN
jgi:hypothetical protein